jgi:hypothetical protein
MCFKKSVPKPPPPPPPPAPPQEAKAPDTEVVTKRKKEKMSAMTGADAGVNSTLLTGPSGLDPAALTTSKTSLLGS